MREKRTAQHGHVTSWSRGDIFESRDGETKAVLFAEGKHVLNMEERGSLPVVVMMEVLQVAFGDD